MKNCGFLVLLAALPAFTGTCPAIGQNKGTSPPQAKAVFTQMSESEQTGYLDNLLPPNKRVGVITSYLLASDTSEINQQTVCSASGSGSASPTYSGSDTYNVHTYSDAVCRQLHDVRNETVLEMDDPSPSQTGHLIFISCTSGLSKGQKRVLLGTLGYGAIFMHRHSCLMQEGPVVHVALGREKHGQWEIAVGTREKLGGKVKVSEYAVIKVEKFDIVSPAAR